MNEIENMFARLHGLDANQEIVNLCYEVTYVRFLLSFLVKACSESNIKLKEEDFEKARIDAQEFVKNKFPKLGITFPTKEESTNSSSELPT